MSTGIASTPRLHHPDDEQPSSLNLSLVVQDPETVAELLSLSDPATRDDFALKALRIGVLALRQARGRIDAEAVRKEGDRLLAMLQERLEGHTRQLHDRVGGTLKEYFDPQSGRFQERVERLISKDGELEILLRRQLGKDDSELARTLSQHFGHESQLLKWLNPDQSQGLLAALQTVLDEQLCQQRDRVLGEFSLDNKEGALARFIGELTDRQDHLTEELQLRIDGVIRQFSLDDETSALSRLVANVERAQRTITSEFSLDHEASALSRLRKMLEHTNSAIEGHLSLDDETSALARLKRELLGLLELQRESHIKFQEEVKLALKEMVVRKQESERSTIHGMVFEDAVVELMLRESHKAGDLAERTGNSVGNIRNCKVGDAVIVLGPDTVAPGGRIVMEAKEKAGYQLPEAHSELQMARDNRSAQVGLFVFSKRTAPAGIEPLFRRGSDVFVVWDIDDDTSDIYLKAGLTIARALVTQRQQADASTAADHAAMEKAILEVDRQLQYFDDLTRMTTTIQNNSEKLLSRYALMRKSLETQLTVLREKIGCGS